MFPELSTMNELAGIENGMPGLTKAKLDEFVKSRHTGENRCPDFL